MGILRRRPLRDAARSIELGKDVGGLARSVAAAVRDRKVSEDEASTIADDVGELFRDLFPKASDELKENLSSVFEGLAKEFKPKAK